MAFFEKICPKNAMRWWWKNIWLSQSEANILYPRNQLGLYVIMCLSEKSSILIKLDVLGVKLQVNEVKKLEFDIHFLKIVFEYFKVWFEKSAINSWRKCPNISRSFPKEFYNQIKIKMAMWKMIDYESAVDLKVISIMFW